MLNSDADSTFFFTRLEVYKFSVRRAHLQLARAGIRGYPRGVRIFYLCYCFRARALRARGRKRACAGGIHYGKCTESSTPYASALAY